MGLPVPLENARLDLAWGPGEPAEESVPFLLVHLKSTGDLLWLERFLGKGARWWKTASSRLPSMREILEAMPVTKRKVNAKHTVVPITVRGRKLLVVHARAPPILALQDQPPRL